MDGKPVLCNKSIAKEDLFFYEGNAYPIELFVKARKEYNEDLGEGAVLEKTVKDVYVHVFADHSRYTCAEFSLDEFKSFFSIPPQKGVAEKFPALYGFYKTLVDDYYATHPLHKYEFQIEDIATLCLKNRAVLSFEQGLGKTLSSIVWCEIKKRIDNRKKILIVVPQDLIIQWIASARDVLGINISRLNSISDIKQMLAAEEGYYITHFEFLSVKDTAIKGSKDRKRGYYRAIKRAFDIIVVDEFTKIKGDSLRGDAVRSLKAPCKLGLSGTPVKNMAEDICFLWGWLFGYNSKLYPYGYNEQKKFLNDFGVYSKNSKTGSTKLLPELNNIHILWTMIAPAIVRRTKAQLRAYGFNLAPKNYHYIPVDFTQAEARAYSRLYEPDWLSRVWRQKGFTGFARNKFDALHKIIDAVEMAGEQVVIFTGMQELASHLKELYGSRAEIANGTVSPVERSEDTIPRFKRGDFPILVAGMEAINVGYDLYNANNVVIMDYLWEATTLDQAVDRCHRIVSSKDVNIFLLYVKDSIDETMIHLINNKREAIKQAIDYE